MAMKKPVVKTGSNRGRRVYWVECPRCGSGPERGVKVKATQDLRDHECKRDG